MSAISDGELLRLWEAAQAVPPVHRPAALLRAAEDDDAAERLPIGARDRRLLALRQQCFGSSFEALADCPVCGASAELTFDSGAIDALPIAAATLTCTVGDTALELRLPNTLDLAAIRDAACEDDARARLAMRCIVNIGSAALSDDAIDAVARALSDADPGGDLTVAVTCPECGASWEAAFDPAAYLLREIDAAAIGTLREIDALASAYGWSESEILSLSRARRGTYLRMVTG